MPKELSSRYARIARDVRMAQIMQTGIKNYQAVEGLPLVTVNNGLRAYRFIELGSPAQFRRFLPQRLPRDKYYVRSMQGEGIIHNACNFPVRITAYQLQPRNNITQDYEEIYPTGVPTPDLSYTDPTASPLFRRLFDVTHTDTQLVQAGMPFIIKQSKYFPSLRVISSNVEGSFDYTLTPLSSVMLVTVESIALNGRGTGPIGDGPKFNQILCTAKYNYKISYYSDIAKRPYNEWDTNSGTQIQRTQVWSDLYFRPATNSAEQPRVPYPTTPAINIT